MKKVNIFIFSLLLSILTFGQEKKITFTKELTYQLNSPEKKSTFSKLLIFSSKNGENLTKFELNGVPMMFYQDKLGMSPVSFGLDNHLEESWFSNYFSGMDYMTRADSKFKTEKLKTSETILGFKCQHYLIDFNSDENLTPEERDNHRIKICIDEKNDINNFPVLVKIVDQFSASKTLGHNLKGLILKVGDAKDYDKEPLILQNIVDKETSVYYNHQLALMTQQRKTDSLMLDYKKQQDEYAADSTAVLDSAYVSNYDWIPNYESTYKIDLKKEPDLAIDNPSNASYFSKMPAYCKDLKKNLPTFENKELGRHLHNYAGQVCDMYLTQFQNNTVAEKITLDEIRREVIYFLDIREKLNKSDQTKLDHYLKNLD